MTEFDRIRQDFEDALERLKRGKPNCSVLKERQRLGKLKISIYSVALEANRSRTLIGTSDCKYLDVRTKILEFRPAPSGRGISLQQLAINRSRELRELKVENLRILSHNAALIIALEERDKLLYSLKRNTSKASQQTQISPLIGGNVHRLGLKRTPRDRSGLP